MRFKRKKKLSKVRNFVGLRVEFSQFDSIWLSFLIDYSANSMDLLWTLKMGMYKKDFKAVKHYIPLLLPPSVLALYFGSIIDIFMYIRHPNHCLLLMFCKRNNLCKNTVFDLLVESCILILILLLWRDYTLSY